MINVSLFQFFLLFVCITTLLYVCVNIFRFYFIGIFVFLPNCSMFYYLLKSQYAYMYMYVYM